MTATRCLTQGNPRAPAVLGTAFAPLPGSFHGDENPAWGRDVAGNNKGKPGQSQSLGVNLPPPLHGTPVAGPLTVPRAVLEVPPIFLQLCHLLPLRCVWDRPAQALRIPSRVLGADGDEDFLQTPSPPGSAA